MYGDYSLDEISGIATKDDAIAMSGYFTANLTIMLVNGEINPSTAAAEDLEGG